ncbi:hypothetical protein, partial [Kitasatospora nipponensis]|uniref:hypothetical protein n=1 Tax=Kitasatospora nipponensis TaxID=258049 RepID=UPI0031D05B6A
QGTDTSFKPLSQALRAFVLFTSFFRVSQLTRPDSLRLPGVSLSDSQLVGFPSTDHESLSEAFGGFVSGIRLPGRIRWTLRLDVLCR